MTMREKLHCGVGHADAAPATDPRFLGREGHQRRAWRNDGMSKRRGPRIAIARGPAARIRFAADCDDNIPRVELTFAGGKAKAILIAERLDSLHRFVQRR